MFQIMMLILFFGAACSQMLPKRVPVMAVRRNG